MSDRKTFVVVLKGFMNTITGWWEKWRDRERWTLTSQTG